MEVLAEWQVPRAVYREKMRELFRANVWGSLRLISIAALLFWGFSWFWDRVGVEALSQRFWGTLGGVVLMGVCAQWLTWMLGSLPFWPRGEAGKVTTEGLLLPMLDEPDRFYPWAAFAGFQVEANSADPAGARDLCFQLREWAKIDAEQCREGRAGSRRPTLDGRNWLSELIICVPADLYDSTLRASLEDNVARKPVTPISLKEADRNGRNFAIAAALWGLGVAALLAILVQQKIHLFGRVELIPLGILVVTTFVGPGTITRRLMVYRGCQDSALLRSKAHRADALGVVYSLGLGLCLFVILAAIFVAQLPVIDWSGG